MKVPAEMAVAVPGEVPAASPKVVPAEVRAVFEGPCALVAGGHADDGGPLATWAWGVEFSNSGVTARVVVVDPIGFKPGGLLAITAGDLPTTRSIQLKGRIVAVEPPTPDDLYRAARHVEGFRLALERVDGVEREKTSEMQNLPREQLTAHVVEILAVFDQSPGPRAGAALET